MSRTPLPFHVEDISAVARSLQAQLAAAERPPGHLALLNMLARSAGARNFQHLRAQAVARVKLEAPPPEPIDFALLERLARHFDADGRMLRWPPKASQVEPCLWVLWSRLPARLAMTEREIGDRLGRLALPRPVGARLRLDRAAAAEGARLRRLDADPGGDARVADGLRLRGGAQLEPASFALTGQGLAATRLISASARAGGAPSTRRYSRPSAVRVTRP